MRWHLAVVVVVVALAGAGATDPTAAQGTEALSVHGTLTPATIRFADPLVADVEVQYDPSVVDGRSIRVLPNFRPFVQTSSPAVTRSQRGDLAVLRMRYALQCLTDGCLPAKGALELRLPRLAVTGTQDGRRVRAVASWPALRVVSRLRDRADTGRISFRHQRVLPPPAYGVSPGALAAGLVAAAALAALAAVALLAREWRRRPARSPDDASSMLERALRFARDSATRPDPGDRRRALEFLAEAVDDAGDERLAGRVRETAWVATPPTPRSSTELADDVEAATGGT
jgi:hypothetical protein